MGALSDIVKFEGSKMDDMIHRAGKDPMQLVIGAGDPASAGLWSKVTGKDYEPYVDQFGGATSEDYKSAERKGIDTTAGKGMHNVARATVGVILGGYGAEAMGMGGGGAGAAEGGAGAGGAGGTGGWGGGNGVPSIAPPGGAGSRQEQSDLEPVRADEHSLAALQAYSGAVERNADEIALSSRELKVPAPGGLSDGDAPRPAQGQHPVDANGMQIAAIKALHERVQGLKSRIDAALRRRGA